MQVFQLPEGFGGRRCCAAAAAHELVSGGAGGGLLGLVRELCGLSGRNNFIAEQLVRGWAGLVYSKEVVQKYNHAGMWGFRGGAVQHPDAAPQAGECMYTSAPELARDTAGVKEPRFLVRRAPVIIASNLCLAQRRISSPPCRRFVCASSAFSLTNVPTTR